MYQVCYQKKKSKEEYIIISQKKIKYVSSVLSEEKE